MSELNVAREGKGIAHTCLTPNTLIISAKKEPIFVVSSSSGGGTKTSVNMLQFVHIVLMVHVACRRSVCVH